MWAGVIDAEAVRSPYTVEGQNYTVVAQLPIQVDSFETVHLYTYTYNTPAVKSRQLLMRLYP